MEKSIKIGGIEHLKQTLDTLGAPEEIKTITASNKGASDCVVTISDKACTTASFDVGHWATITCKNADGTTSTNTWCSTKPK